MLIPIMIISTHDLACVKVISLSPSTGSADCLSLLVRKGALVNVQDKIGVTPLHLAARNG